MMNRVMYGATALFAVALWAYCVADEVINAYYGVRLRIIPLVLLVAVTIAHWVIVVRYVQQPMPFLKRTLPMMILQLALVVVFALILFQAAMPIWL